MRPFPQVAAFILAGGVSSRMGCDKGLLALGGVPLVARTARLLEPLVAAVTVVGSPERYVALGVNAIADQNPGGSEDARLGQGPLAGIVTALQGTRTPWNLILACDLPYVSAEWISWLLARTMSSRAQIVLPRTPHGLEPLAAVYSRECAEPIAAAFARGVRKVTDALRELRVEHLAPSEWGAHDPDGRVLRNMNVPADYEEARLWWEARTHPEPGGTDTG